MSRKTNTLKTLVVVGAVAGAALGISPAQAATPVVTKVGPPLAGTTVALPMAISGTGFSSDIKSVVWQNASEYTCLSSAVVVVSSTLLYAVKDTDCTAGLQKVELHSVPTPTDATTILGSEFAPAASKTVTFVTPADLTAAVATPNTGVAGTKITFTGLANLVASGLSATLGGKPIGSVRYVSASSFTGVAPAGINFGDAPLQVKSGGVLSAVQPGEFSYKPTLSIAPAFAPKDTPGQILITGLGLKPAAPATVEVTVCGVVATQVPVTTAKPHTDTKYWVTAPTAQAIEDAATAALANGVVSTFNEDGGTCVVKVKVDVNGATADVAAVADDPATTTVDETAPAQENPTSVVTKTSTFTYAAY